MSTKNLYNEKYKNKVLSSTSNIKAAYKIKKTQSRQKLGRTSSALNLPKVRYNHETNETMSLNSTGFSFHNNKKYNDNEKIKTYLNYNSLEDFLGKKKDPLEKEKELYENMKEEKLKIKNVLSNLISWDNEPTLKEIESFKMINIKGQNKNINNINLNNNINMNNNNNISKSNNSDINNIKENKFLGDATKLIKHKVPIDIIMKDMKISKGTQIKEKKLKLTQLKFSVFDKDYDPKKYKPTIKKEKDKKKEEEEKINKFKEKDYLIQFQKEQRRIEIVRKDEIAILYKNIIINKLKKKKFIEVLDQTYRLLDKARTEYS